MRLAFSACAVSYTCLLSLPRTSQFCKQSGSNVCPKQAFASFADFPHSTRSWLTSKDSVKHHTCSLQSPHVGFPLTCLQRFHTNHAIQRLLPPPDPRKRYKSRHEPAFSASEDWHYHDHKNHSTYGSQREFSHGQRTYSAHHGASTSQGNYSIQEHRGRSPGEQVLGKEMYKYVFTGAMITYCWYLDRRQYFYREFLSEACHFSLCVAGGRLRARRLVQACSSVRVDEVWNRAWYHS